MFRRPRPPQPSELKNEISKLLKFEFIGEKHHWTVRIEKHDNDTVFVTTTIERTLKNITSSNKNYPAMYQVYDCGYNQGPSRILELGVKDETGHCENFEGVESPVPHSIEARIKKTVTVRPEGKITLYGKATQYRRRIDSLYETFLFPAVNPEIEVIIPEDFEYEVEFGTRGEGQEKEQYSNRHRLIGVYIPGQFMIVRWWPKTNGNAVAVAP